MGQSSGSEREKSSPRLKLKLNPKVQKGTVMENGISSVHGRERDAKNAKPVEQAGLRAEQSRSQQRRR